MTENKQPFEEAQILSYMEAALKPDRESRRAYLISRLEEIKGFYTKLKLQKEEIETYRDPAYKETVMARLSVLFRNNYAERVAVVTSLRQMGERVDDPFVPVT